MTRTLAIGDIHGGLRALKQILERAKITQNDVLIFLGDYVDGWSESAQTVSFLIELFKLGNSHSTCNERWLFADFTEEMEGNSSVTILFNFIFANFSNK